MLITFLFMRDLSFSGICKLGRDVELEAELSHETRRYRVSLGPSNGGNRKYVDDIVLGELESYRCTFRARLSTFFVFFSLTRATTVILSISQLKLTVKCNERQVVSGTQQLVDQNQISIEVREHCF